MSETRNRKTVHLPAISMSVVSRLVVLVVIIILGFCIDSSFLTMRNINNNVSNASILIILGIGQTIAIITNGPDLSSGSVMTISAVIAAILMKNYDVNFIVAILIALLCGALIGMLNGYMIAYVGIPSFISTYGLMWAIFGFAYVLLNGYVLYSFGSAFRFIGNGSLFGFLGMPIVVMVIIAILGVLLLRKTSFGRKCYAVGSNNTCAKMSGINSKRVVMGAFVLSAVLSAFAGVLFVARENAVQADIGNAYLLPVLAAVFMGGTSPAGGQGGIFGTIMGALIITIVTNCMNLLAVPSEWREAIIGILIITTVLLDTIINKRIAKRQTEIS